MNYYFEEDINSYDEDYFASDDVRYAYAPDFGRFCDVLKENHQAMNFEPSRSSFFGYDEKEDVWRTLNLYDDKETIQAMKNVLSKKGIVFYGNTLVSYPRTFVFCKMNHSGDVKDWKILDSTTVDNAHIYGNGVIEQWIKQLLPYADAHDVMKIGEELKDEVIGYYMVCDIIITEKDEEGIIQP